MKTEEWQQQYEADGYVDLWVEEEFNSGSRLVVSFNPIIAATGMAFLIYLKTRQYGKFPLYLCSGRSLAHK